MSDLGSFQNTDNGTYKRTIYGLESDIPKLQAACTAEPKLFNSGEFAYCCDTGHAYCYERTTATWYPQFK